MRGAVGWRCTVGALPTVCARPYSTLILCIDLIYAVCGIQNTDRDVSGLGRQTEGCGYDGRQWAQTLE